MASIVQLQFRYETSKSFARHMYDKYIHSVSSYVPLKVCMALRPRPRQIST
jgi:hypothetical protein